MKLGKNKLAIALGAALSLGIASQASADVYGLSSLAVDNLLIDFSAFGGAQLFTFSTNQDASLNGVADPTSGAASCNGIFGVSNTCGAGTPRLSGTVQNAPGGGVTRGENDYTQFGTGAGKEYSNAEAAIIQAVILGDSPTKASAISESNLTTGNSAQANTNVSSNTFLQLQFSVDSEATFSIAFDALIKVLAEATGVDFGKGIAQANSSLSVTLANAAGQTIASWAPTGAASFVGTCAAGLTCTSTETLGLSLQNAATSIGSPNGESGSGSYSLEVAGLTTGNYSLALNTTTSTDLARIPTPLPGTLLLMGTGLLVGGRRLRRNK